MEIRRIHGFLVQIFRGREPAALIKFLIVGKVCFRNDTPNFSTGNHRAAVIHLPANEQRYTHRHSHSRILAGSFADFCQAICRRIQKALLEKQVCTGITGQCQFRKYHQITASFFRFGHFGTDILCIFRYVCHLHRRHSTGNSYMIQHGIPPLFQFSLSYHIMSDLQREYHLRNTRKGASEDAPELLIIQHFLL